MIQLNAHTLNNNKQVIVNYLNKVVNFVFTSQHLLSLFTNKKKKYIKKLIISLQIKWKN